MNIRPFVANCGVLIENVDLADLSDQEFEEIKRVFVEHGLVFFRDQNLSPEQHIKLAKKFGEILPCSWLPEG